MRKAPRAGQSGARRALELGHAMTTTAVAATVCAVAVAVPALASGGSPFAASSHAPAPSVVTHAPAPVLSAVTHAHAPTLSAVTAHQPKAPSSRSHAAPPPPASTSHDRFVHLELSPAGVPGSVAAAPGQSVPLQFTLTQPSKVILAVTGGALTAYGLSYDGGQNGTDSSALGPNNTYIPAGTLPAGTHTITIEPSGTSAGTLLYALTAPPG